MTLLEKMRKARRLSVPAGGYTFTVRCPTDLEAARLGRATIEDLLQFVVGWENVQEIDLIPGGAGVPVPFAADVCREWLAYRPDLWGAISDGVLGAYNRHAAELEGLAKN